MYYCNNIMVHQQPGLEALMLGLYYRWYIIPDTMIVLL